MKNHIFKLAERSGNKKIYLVKCLKTTGEFSTKLWDLEKVTKNTCPCCNEEIK